jgi:DNA-binding CsgD family transcriptional regulator
LRPDGVLRRLAAAAPASRTVGRDAMLAQLKELVNLAGGAVILAGGPGAGKSHLARAVVQRLVAAGAGSEVIQGSTATVQVPLGACAHLVPPLTGEVPLAGLIAAALDRQRRRARHSSLVILAEDIDRLDDASATLLAHLVGVPRLAVVCTAREITALPGPLGGLLRDRRLEPIEVGPLDLEGIAALAAQAAGADLDGESVALLHEATDGNPLWVNEIVRAAASREGLVPTAGGLRLPAHATTGGLDQVLDTRLRELTDAERDALSLLAVGGNLPARTLETMVGTETPVRLAAAGLVAPTEHNGMLGVRLVHPLYRQALLRRLSRFEIRLLLRRLIAGTDMSVAMGGVSHQDRAMIIRLALWHAELGEGFDPEALGWAAQAVHWGLLDVVRRHLSHGPGEPVEPVLELGLDRVEDRWAAAFRLASAAWRQNRTCRAGLDLALTILFAPEHAADMVTLLEDLLTLAATDEERALVGITQGVWLFWTSGQRDLAISELRALEKELAPPWDRMVAATGAGLTFHGGQVADSLAVLEDVHPLPGAPPEAQVVHASPYAAALMLSGRVEEGVELAEKALPIVYGLGERWFRSMGEMLISSHWGGVCLSRFATVEESSRRMAELLPDTDDENRALFLGMAARCRLGQGLPVTAAAELEQAIRSHGPASMFGFRPLLHTTRAVALAWSGRVQEAGLEVIEARRWNMPPRFFDAELDLAEVIVLAADGRRSRAARLATEVSERVGSVGNGYFAFVAAYLAARLRPTAASQAAFESAASLVDVPLVAVARRHVAALLDGDASDLEAVAEAAIDLDEQLLAVEILQAAVARAQERGTHPSQLRLRAALRAQRDRCEQAHSPIVDVTSDAIGLTARELEIAGLAASGWTSAAIADELVLSVRTVESHLYRAFAKLGIRSREELGPALPSGAAARFSH